MGTVREAVLDACVSTPAQREGCVCHVLEAPAQREGSAWLAVKAPAQREGVACDRGGPSPLQWGVPLRAGAAQVGAGRAPRRPVSANQRGSREIRQAPGFPRRKVFCKCQGGNYTQCGGYRLATRVSSKEGDMQKPRRQLLPMRVLLPG